MTKQRFIEACQKNEDFFITYSYWLEGNGSRYKADQPTFTVILCDMCSEIGTTPKLLFDKIRQYYNKKFGLTWIYSDATMQNLLLVGSSEDFLISQPE